MAAYKMLVLSNPVNDREDEFNDWYSNKHLKDVVAVPGIRSAQRFKLRHAVGFGHKWQYIAIYDIETDDLNATVADMMSRQGAGEMHVSDALDFASALAGVFEACSPIVTAE